MELERFRLIKERLKEIVDIVQAIENETLELSETEKVILEEELEQLTEEIHNSDLSNIPFEEYEGFFNIGFDFNGTGANIDFNIIDVSLDQGSPRYQGCNIRNLDLSKFRSTALDDSSFDSEIIKDNPEYFAPQIIIDSEARKRYYSFNLTLEDLKKYDLSEIPIKRFNGNLSTIIEKIGIDKTIHLDEEIVDLMGYSFSSEIRRSDFTPESSSEEIEKLLKTTVIDEMTNKNTRMNQREKLFQSRYVCENLSEYIIDFKDNQKELKDKYFKSELELSDIINNLDLFRGKKFLEAFNFDFKYEIEKNYPDVTENQIIYLMEKLPNIFELLKDDIKEFIYVANEIDIEKEPAENQSAIIDLYKRYMEENPGKTYNSRAITADTVVTEILSYEELINSFGVNIDDYHKQKMLNLVATPNFARLEAVEGLNIKEKIKSGDYKFFEFFYKYGIDTVLDFEAKNGALFTQKNGANIKFIDEAYHYSDFSNGIKSFDDPNPFYTDEQFEEYIRRMIVYERA